LTDVERHGLFGVPEPREDLARHYTLSTLDLALVEKRRGDANRIGLALQRALLRQPGCGFSMETGAPPCFVAFVGNQIGVGDDAFSAYAARPATASFHSRESEAALGLRPPTRADLPMILEEGTQAAWSTDREVPIVRGTIAALQQLCITLPAPAVIERVGLASRARGRRRPHEAPLASVSAEVRARLDPPPYCRSQNGRDAVRLVSRDQLRTKRRQYARPARSPDSGPRNRAAGLDC
jgi:hypothetical protein